FPQQDEGVGEVFPAPHARLADGEPALAQQVLEVIPRLLGLPPFRERYPLGQVVARPVAAHDDIRISPTTYLPTPAPPNDPAQLPGRLGQPQRLVKPCPRHGGLCPQKGVFVSGSPCHFLRAPP